MLQQWPWPQPELVICTGWTCLLSRHTGDSPSDARAAAGIDFVSVKEGWGRHGLDAVAEDATEVLTETSKNLRHPVVRLDNHLEDAGVGRMAVDVVEDIPS